MTTFTVTLPDGTTDTRTSKTKTYTHAVIVWANDTDPTTPNRWLAVSYHASQALAEKGARRFDTWTMFEQVQVVPVNQ